MGWSPTTTPPADLTGTMNHQCPSHALPAERRLTSRCPVSLMGLTGLIKKKEKKSPQNNSWNALSIMYQCESISGWIFHNTLWSFYVPDENLHSAWEPVWLWFFILRWLFDNLRITASWGREVKRAVIRPPLVDSQLWRPRSPGNYFSKLPWRIRQKF